jgi:hypothetical protein
VEFLVCMLLASILTGGRVAQDVIATITGNTPPHVERARLRAERERLRIQRQNAAGQSRSAFADGKPKLKDVAAVYWGDALQDAIDAHDRRRAEKKEQRAENQAADVEQRPARKVRPSWRRRAARAWQMLVNPVGGNVPDSPSETAEPERQPTDQDSVPTPAADGPIITCDRCGARLADAEGGYQHPDGSTCPKAQPPTSPKEAAPAPTAPARPDTGGDGIHTCPRCGGSVADTVTTRGRYCLTCDQTSNYKNHQGPGGRYDCESCGQPGYAVTVRPRTALNTDGGTVPVLVHYLNDSPTCPTPEQIRQAKQAEAAIQPPAQPNPATAGPHPSHQRGTYDPDQKPQPEGDTMTDTDTATGAAPTGEAVNYETAMAELDKLEAAQIIHLDQAKAALQELQQAKARISDTQATYRPAAEAASLINQHLTALGVDQETVAATGTIADAMPPNKVDEMFDHLESMEDDARQQVENAETALAATHAARASLVEKYGEADAVVQEHLGGDSTFLAGTGTTGTAAQV